MNILGIGSVIEFEHSINGEIKEATHVDRVCSVQVYKNGKVSYYTELYLELSFADQEIFSERIVKPIWIESTKFGVINEPPFKDGDIISFHWDDGEVISGEVHDTKHVHCGHMDPQWRALVKVGSTDYYLGEDELVDLKTKVITKAEDK